MKTVHIIMLLIINLLLIISCGINKPNIVYLPGETKIEYRDSTVYKDSIVYTPVEVIKEIVPQLPISRVQGTQRTLKWIHDVEK